jgi:hypothetical protein
VVKAGRASRFAINLKCGEIELRSVLSGMSTWRISICQSAPEVAPLVARHRNDSSVNDLKVTALHDLR